ncbi:elongation factor P [Pedobacter steynii]|uniref:Elongation factor P n=2 Tax=Sphingobacteriaceae TaxID=84566 RepID=A0A1G9U2X8_9SPHI|nr:elongation factor P [Pedobacter steynii]
MGSNFTIYIFMAKASEIKVGNILRFNNELVTVTEILHRTPGKGGAFYLGKFRNIKTGKIVEARLGTDEAVEICRVETNDYQYLYEEGDYFVVMDNTSFEQFSVAKALFGPSAKFIKEGMDVIVSFESEEPIMAQAPNFVELEITYAEPAVKGDTSSGALKMVTTENGVELKVPLFVNQGDKVKVDTRTGEYVERVK